MLVCKEKIVQVEDKTFPVHKDLVWMDLVTDAKVGDGYVDGVLVPVRHEAPTLTKDEADKQEYVKAFSIGDELDVIQKQFRVMIKAGQLSPTPETRAWLKKIDVIKAVNKQRT